MGRKKISLDRILLILLIVLVAGALGRSLIRFIVNTAIPAQAAAAMGNVERRFFWSRFLETYSMIYGGAMILVSLFAVIAAGIDGIRLPVWKQALGFCGFLAALCVCVVPFGLLDKTQAMRFNGDYSLLFSITGAILPMLAAFIVILTMGIIRECMNRRLESISGSI